MTASYTWDAKLCPLKITEAVSLIQVYLGLLTKKQARCTVTWHAHNTDCSDKFQGEKRLPPLFGSCIECILRKMNGFFGYIMLWGEKY